MKERKKNNKNINSPYKILYKLTNFFINVFFVFCIVLIILYIMGNYQNFLDKSQILLLTVLSFCSVSMTVMAIISLIENTVLIFLEKSKNNQIKNILWDIFTLIFGIIILIFSIFVKQLSLGI
jgi:cellulose synthase/poly-beta-1,6-N-acetylglucosamine synthase-like glycosyltransferase